MEEDLLDANEELLNGTSFNFSLDNLDNVEVTHKVLSYDMELVLVFIYSFIGVIGLLSNIALIAIILGKKMQRTPKNIYILNLGISGISTSLICVPPTLVQCLYGGKWYFGLIACKLMPAMQGTNVLVSSGTITAIAVDRWLSITQVSNGLPNQLSHRKVCLINVAIWLVSFIIASPILVFQTIESVDLPWTSYSMCVEVWPTAFMKSSFTIIILCVQYLMPLIVLPVVHSKILKFLEENTGFALDAKRQEKERKRNKRMTLVLSCIAVIFVISSLPLHIFFTITDLGLVSMPSPSSYFFSLGLCHAFAMSSCVSNPVLYGWFNTNLRKEFVKILPFSLIKVERGGKVSRNNQLIVNNNNHLIISNDINSNVTTSSRITNLQLQQV